VNVNGQFYSPPLGPGSIVLFVAMFAVVALLTWRRPAWALAALVALVPFAFARAYGETTFTLPKAELAGLAVGMLMRRTPVRPLLDAPLRPATLAWVALCVAAALDVTQAEYKLPALRELLKWLEYAAGYGLAALAMREDPQEELVARALTLGGATVFLLALIQLFTSAASVVVVDHHRVARFVGQLEGPNQLAGYFELVVPVSLALALRAHSTRALAAASLGLIGTMLTLSRAGIAGVSLASGIVLWLERRTPSVRSVATVLVVAATLGTAAVIAGGSASRFLGAGASEIQPDGHLGSRKMLWHAATTFWLAHPLLGIGGGNYELELPRAGVNDVKTHANSLYLHNLAEGGILLGGATVALIAISIGMLAGRRKRMLALGVLGGCVALALHQVVDDLFFYPKVGLEWALLMGAALGVPGDEKEDAARP